MITLALTARNEEQAIGSCLDSLLAAVDAVEARLPERFDVIAMLDQCTDRTAAVVATYPRVRAIICSGGVVEAQRCAVRQSQGPFVIFSDADIRIDTDALLEVTRAMLDDTTLRVAYPKKHPLPPSRKTLIARALYTYNRVNGFQTKRNYFNGKFFAMRNWQVPTLAELQPRIEQLPTDHFYNFQAGMRIDDVYLSRQVLRNHGPNAIRHIPNGCICYRPPETYRSMYRTYRRMRMEIERLDQLFPETAATHKSLGTRSYDKQAIREASRRDRFDWYVFRIALQVCKLHYRSERYYYQHLAKRYCPAWEIIEESKTALPAE